MRSSTRGRSSAMNDPVAAKFLRTITSSASVARYPGEACLARSRSNAASRSRSCSSGSPVWRSSLPLDRSSGRIRSRIPGSAWSRSHVGVSMMCASASWTTRPSMYGIEAPLRRRSAVTLGEVPGRRPGARREDRAMAVARWKDLCFDAGDAHALARFWGRILGLAVELHDDGDAVLRGARPEETIWVNAVPEPKTVKHRIHLGLDVASIEPLLEAGATMVLPAEESGFCWSVLADPGAGERWALGRGGQVPDPPARRYGLCVDTAGAATAHDLAGWWGEVWGGRVEDDDRGFSCLEQVPGLPLDGIVFLPVPAPKPAKNR